MSITDYVAGQRRLSNLYGTYRGFAPTDESPIGMGELKLSFNPFVVTRKMATGLGIFTERIPTLLFSPMSGAEVANEYVIGSDLARRTQGFKLGEVKFLFVPDAQSPQDDAMGLIIRGNGLSDLLGPTTLLSPAQQMQGYFEKTLRGIEDNFGFDKVPLLAFGGKLKRE